MQTNGEKMKKIIHQFLLVILFCMSFTLQAAEYVLDTKGAHAFIQFKIKHLGYSWLLGRFNTFDGHFSYNETNPDAAKVTVNIDTASIDTNLAERDKHLRGKDFLEVKKYPSAKFVSTSFKDKGNGLAAMEGQLTLHGITQPVTLNVEYIGHGSDPWGGYRRGFSASTLLTLKDFGIDFDLGPASQQVELFISVEGIRN
jgi:polyisoprenoid-binding protein YceI